jgi:hypothetical protein
MPQVSVRAAAEIDNPTAIDVSWSSPGASNFYSVYQVDPSGVMRAISTDTRATSIVFHGGHGQSYWFWVTARTDLGWTDANGSQVVIIPHVGHGTRI